MDEKRKERIKEIFSDQDFVLFLLKLETPEQVQAAFKEKGLEVSMTDILAIRGQLSSYLREDDSSELSAEELENVSGGIIPIFLSSVRRPTWL